MNANMFEAKTPSTTHTHACALHIRTDLHHLAQLGQVAGDEVEEGEFVKVLGPLVAHLHHLVVALQQRRLTQALPAAAVIQGLGCLQRHLVASERTESDNRR